MLLSFRAIIAGLVWRATRQAQLSQGANEEQMAEFCVATIQSAMLLGKIKRNSQSVETTVREAVTHQRGYAVQSRG
jgi:hypothetical protein